MLDVIKGTVIYILLLIPSILISAFYKITKKQVWLISEVKLARDNGSVFFKYMKQNHPNVKCIYAMDKKCSDYSNLKNYPGIIQWGTLKHYFYYLIASKNISSNKNGNPNHKFFSVMHLYLNLYNNRVFLQHGVLYQNLEMFHQKNTKYKMFICGAKPEYDFINEKYGYKNNEVRYTGLARFDNLHDFIIDNKMILYMPTWRRNLKTEEEFINSKYFKEMVNLLNNKKLEQILEEKNKIIYFCPHFCTNKFKEKFNITNKMVKYLDSNNINIQELLKKCSMLITDYSSVHTDVAYMNKPIIYFQYDEKDFKEKHIGKCWKDTYYDYKQDGFGEVCNSVNGVINTLIKIINQNMKNEQKYTDRIHNFFPLYDTNNCERIYQEILEMDGVKKCNKI